MAYIDDDDILDLAKGIDNYIDTCITTFNNDPVLVISVMMSRIVHLAKFIGGEKEFLLLLDLARESILDNPDPEKLN